MRENDWAIQDRSNVSNAFLEVFDASYEVQGSQLPRDVEELPLWAQVYDAVHQPSIHVLEHELLEGVDTHELGLSPCCVLVREATCCKEPKCRGQTIHRMAQEGKDEHRLEARTEEHGVVTKCQVAATPAPI